MVKVKKRVYVAPRVLVDIDQQVRAPHVYDGHHDVKEAGGGNAHLQHRVRNR